MKCPVCGYTYGSNRQQGNDITEMLSKRNETTRKLIKKVHRDVIKNIPSDRMLKTYWGFLKAVSHIEDRELRMGINQYYKANHLNFGRGLAYLKAIIVNKHLNKDKQIKLERKRLGSSPPIREI